VEQKGEARRPPIAEEPLPGAAISGERFAVKLERDGLAERWLVE
jgi:hypothetical protein